jgi:hypothetical protein
MKFFFVWARMLAASLPFRRCSNASFILYDSGWCPIVPVRCSHAAALYFYQRKADIGSNRSILESLRNQILVPSIRIAHVNEWTGLSVGFMS